MKTFSHLRPRRPISKPLPWHKPNCDGCYEPITGIAITTRSITLCRGCIVKGRWREILRERRGGNDAA